MALNVLPLLFFALPPLDPSVPVFLSKHCIACHNSKLKTANLDLDRLRDPKIALAERDVWETLAERVRNGSMPPQGVPKPDPALRQSVVAWADAHVTAFDSQRPTSPGRVTARRLNRAEYNNTIRDLLGIDFRPADDFPLDDSGHGFDNLGDVLTVSPALLEKYLAAADQIVRAAIVTGPAPKPIVDRYELERLGESKLVPADPEGERLVRKGSLVIRHRFPREAEYDVRVFLRGRGTPDRPKMKLALLAGGKQASVVTVESGPGNRRTFDLRLKLPAGEFETGGAFAYPGPNAAGNVEPRPGFGADEGFYVDVVEIHGPFIKPDELPDSHKRIFVCPEKTPACARNILTAFVSRAWRRPPSTAELAGLERFVTMAQSEGDSFEQGIQLAVKAALVSPHFLFRIEPGTGARSLGDYELASRLSYFLWSSMPDETLFRLAAEKRLRDPEVLAAEARRMLADPKAQALAENFAGQWLELRNLGQVSPDTKRFPNWDADLREAMRRETTLFFASIARENSSILDFIDGKYTFLNERLAEHYKIPGVAGRQFRRVDLTTPERGGVLTQASVLTVTSYPSRTSPVLRGLWVLENFLATPPPAPPADTPQLKEEEIGKSLTLRQQFEMHRANAACAVCHNRIDPLGFGLENYDAVGAWRTHDGAIPLDTAGTLPGGRGFTSPAGMKSMLRQDAEAFTRCLAEKLMIYGLGRGLESGDRPQLRAITKRVASGGYHFSDMIKEIVTSPQFLSRAGGD